MDTGVTVDGDGTFSRLSIKKMTSTKAGKYRVEAKNEVGSDQADFTVNVKGESGVLLREKTIFVVCKLYLSHISLLS